MRNSFKIYLKDCYGLEEITNCSVDTVIIDPPYGISSQSNYRGKGKEMGHNPHPGGRVASNIIRTDEFADSYDKFFVIPKVRQHAGDYNYHPGYFKIAQKRFRDYKAGE